MKYLNYILNSVPNWAKIIIIIVLIFAVFRFEGKIEFKFKGTDVSAIAPNALKKVK